MSSVTFADIETLVVALGGKVREGQGSRIALQLGATVKYAHRPLAGKEAKKTKSRKPVSVDSRGSDPEVSPRKLLKE